MARRFALEHHHPAGVRTDIDDCYGMAARGAGALGHARHYIKASFLTTAPGFVTSENRSRVRWRRATTSAGAAFKTSRVGCEISRAAAQSALFPAEPNPLAPACRRRQVAGTSRID